MRSIPATALAAAVIASPAATATAQEASELTLYRARVLEDSDLTPIGARRDAHAHVRERRVLALEAGTNRIRLGRLPATVDPGSVSVRPVEPEALEIGSLRVVGPRSANRGSPAPGRAVTVELDTGASIEGVVAAAGEPLWALRSPGGLALIFARAIESASETGGAAAIELEAVAARAGRHAIELDYDAGGLSFDVAYTAIRENGRVELSAAVELDNRSGAAFPGASLTLVDRTHAPVSLGLANRDSRIAARTGRFAARVAGDDGLPPGASERELFDAIRADAREILVFEADPSRHGRFPRTSCTSFARPPLSSRSIRAVELSVGGAARSLIPGPVRVVDRGANGRLSPAAETTLSIDAGAGVVRFDVGHASSITGRWHQRGCRTLGERRLRESVELEIGNTSGRDEIVVVRVPNSRWHHRVIAEESPRGRASAGGREYRIEVGAGSSRSIHYTAIYYW